MCYNMSTMYFKQCPSCVETVSLQIWKLFTKYLKCAHRVLKNSHRVLYNPHLVFGNMFYCKKISTYFKNILCIKECL